jgi:hypothetical protein
MGKKLVNFYHLRLQVKCTLFCNLQSRARTHAVLVIDLHELLGNPTTLTHWATRALDLVRLHQWLHYSTKTCCHDIAEILLKVASNTKNQSNQSHPILDKHTTCCIVNMFCPKLTSHSISITTGKYSHPCVLCDLPRKHSNRVVLDRWLLNTGLINMKHTVKVN